MESILGSRTLGEESVQMWELNKRLEAYLSRVKSLEEENGLLKSEIQNLRSSPLETSCWRGHYEEEVAAMRATLDQAFREKHASELAREALHDQVRQVKGQCQKERAAREEAKRLLVAGKKQLEEERRAVLWLQKKATQLEKEAEGLVEVHQEELARLEQEACGFSRSLEEGFRVVAPPGCFQPREVEDYAQQLSSIWQGAVETYKRGVSQAEASLGQAKEELRRATQGNRESQLQLQQLEAELTDLTGRKEALEESLSHQGQLLQGEAEKLQLAVESLEEEKHSLQAQIAQVLEERQQLMHLKMSLSLEVATYRTLLEAESTRLQMPTTMDFKLPAGLKDLRVDANGSKLQVGRLGSRDSRPNPAAFPKANAKPWSPRNKMETSFMASPASLLSKSRSPVAREFQKANTVLQSQSTKGFNVALNAQEEAPTFVDSPAFKLGASQQSQVIKATRIESVSQSFFHESSSAFDSISPNIPYALEEPGSGVKKGEGGEEMASYVEMKEKEGIVGEVEKEDEKQPSDEPPGKAFSQNVLVTETSEIAMKDVNVGELLLEPSLVSTTGTQNGFPSIDSSPTEEENDVALVSNREDVDAMEKLHKDWTRDGQEDIEGFEASAETNGGQVVHDEHQDKEGELSQKTGLFEEEGIGEQSASDAPVGEMMTDKDIKFLEKDEGDDEEHLTIIQADEPQEVSECTPPAIPLGKEIPAKESTEPFTCHCDDPLGAIEGSLEEMEGGTEDLEVVSTEALHLSEDEERRELWSPSRENEEDDLQGEMLGSEFQEVEAEVAAEDFSLLSSTALPPEEHQEEQEPLEEPKVSLCQTDSAMLKEVAILDVEDFNAEEMASEGEDSPRKDENALLKVMDSKGVEEEEVGHEGEDVSRHRDLCEEENDLGNKEKEVFSDMGAVGFQDDASEPKATLQHEEVKHVLEQEIFTGEQTEGAEEDVPQELQMKEKMEKMMEEEGASSSSLETDSHILEGAELQRGAEVTEAKSDEAAGTLEMDVPEELRMEEKMEEEEASSSSLEASSHILEGVNLQRGAEITEAKSKEASGTLEKDVPQELRMEEKMEEKMEEEEASSSSLEADSHILEGAELKRGEEVTEAKNKEAAGTLEMDVPQELRMEEKMEEEEASSSFEADSHILEGVELQRGVEVTEAESEEAAGTLEMDVPQKLQMEKMEEEEASSSTLEADGHILEGAELQRGAEVTEAKSEEAAGTVEIDVPQKLQMEEEEASSSTFEADGHILEGAELQRDAELTEAESEEVAGTLEMEEITGHISPHNLEELGKDTEGSEAQQVKSEARGAEDEQQVVFGKEEDATQSQEATILEPSAIPDATWEAEVPLEVQNDSLHGPEVTSYVDTSDFQPQNDSLESEESLESSDTSPNATHEGDGIEKELETGRQIMLEETLPDHTPLRLYEEEMLSIARESQPLSEGKLTAEPSPVTRNGTALLKEENQQVLEEEESPSSPPPEGNDKEQEAIKDKDRDHMEPDADESGKAPSAKGSEGAKMETSEVLQQDQFPHSATLELSGMEEGVVHDPEHLEVRSEKQSEERSPQQELVEQTPEEETGEDFAWEPEKDSVFQADPVDPDRSEGIIPVDYDSSMEMSDQENMDTQRTHKDSPLTSVADLGEIVLEEELPGGQDKEAESKDLGCAEMVPDVHESYQIVERESLGMEDHAQEEYLDEVNPLAEGVPDRSLEAAVGISVDDMKDSDIMEIVEQAHNLKDLDILEIVEQALEFNQERIKAEQSAEAGPPSMEGDAHSFSASVTSKVQIMTESEIPSDKTKDPVESTHLWSESNTNGLQEDPNFVNFPEEILNGLPNSMEDNVSTSGEERGKKVTIQEEFTREDIEDDLLKVETVSHSPPSIEELQRAGDVGSQIHEKAFLDHQGREDMDGPQSIFAEILQTARGKERELEGENPIGPSFGGDLLHLQPSQRLTFRPEEEEEPWSSEGN
ncbi:nestin [Anolis sagrei]|uniref:nestin n=1 Tax=Anolis sagrei TaxID=38937 RepID=UPI003522F3E2